jgi:hypothetical protein
VFDALLARYASRKMKHTQIDFSKYTLMLKLMPKEGVKAKMVADGVPAQDISTFFIAELDDDSSDDDDFEYEGSMAVIQQRNLPAMLGNMKQEDEQDTFENNVSMGGCECKCECERQSESERMCEYEYNRAGGRAMVVTLVLCLLGCWLACLLFHQR